MKRTRASILESHRGSSLCMKEENPRSQDTIGISRTRHPAPRLSSGPVRRPLEYVVRLGRNVNHQQRPRGLGCFFVVLGRQMIRKKCQRNRKAGSATFVIYRHRFTPASGSLGMVSRRVPAWARDCQPEPEAVCKQATKRHERLYLDHPG